MNFLANLSNRELNIWSMLGFDVGITVYYFYSLLTMPGGIDFTGAAMIKLIVKIIIISIICSILLQALINWRSGEEPRDERDYRFESKANNFAYITLIICVAVVIAQVILSEWFATYSGISVLYAGLSSPMVIVQFLLGALFVAATVKALTQLYLYRKGAG